MAIHKGKDTLTVQRHIKDVVKEGGGLWVKEVFLKKCKRVEEREKGAERKR